MNIKWEANEYENKFSFVHRYGENVIKMIDAPKGSDGAWLVDYVRIRIKAQAA